MAGRVGEGWQLALTLSQNEQQANRMTRLAAVLDHLRATTEIGSVTDPTAYVEGSMDMRWGVFGMATARRSAQPVVFLAVSRVTP